MRIVMMGTGPFALPTFKSLLASSHPVLALITRPPRASRPGQPEPPNPMRAAAEEHGLEVFMPESINSPEAQDILRRLAADLFVVCDYGQILSSATLAIAPFGGINLHGSLLPKYRGAAPINWAIYHGDSESGVTVIHMTPKLDGGPTIAVRATPIHPEETTPELEVRLAGLGVDAVHEALAKLAEAAPGEAVGEPQNKAHATKAPRLTKEQALVDWSRSALEIKNQVRAFQPWPGTYSNWQRESGEPLRVILEKVSLADVAAQPAEPGTVVAVEKDALIVATGRGLLSLEEVKPAGKRSMPIGQWLRGCQLKVGDRFG